MSASEPASYTCGVCGHDIDPEVESFHAIVNREVGGTLVYVCDTHDPQGILGEMLVVDGRLA